MKTTHEIIIIDDVPPEANAMLQALYSRSPKSVKEHLEKVKASGADKFMASYYVGYGHKSIGDCGTTSVFIENVSMLAAKAFQDWPLYNGQEASTRYLDMKNQAVLNPLETDEGKKIQDEWMALYVRALDRLVVFLSEQFPKADDQDQKVWEKAIKAKAFDIARGFLPAGATTYLSWHTNLRQAYDHIKWLRHHPLEEIRMVNAQLHESLKQKYASSFVHKEYESEEAYMDEVMKKTTYYSDPSVTSFSARFRLDDEALAAWKPIFAQRPAKAELPPLARECGEVVATFPLDFGSFRDLQRQRSAVQVMPLLSTNQGFYPWYLSQLPDDLKADAEKTIKEQEERIKALGTTPEIAQYYTAMGYTVTCKLTMHVPSAVYIAELRASQTVHPTLRVRAQELGNALKEAIPELAMHHDTSPDAWNIKRGTQDIVEKQK